MADMKFEEAIKKLEKIVQELEDGDLPLDESLEGTRRYTPVEFAQKLETAKKKVEILLKSEDGTFELEPFEEKKVKRTRRLGD